MQRSESPAASLRTTGSHVLENDLRASATHHDKQKPSYRLFPSVEPTPPASPLDLHRNALRRDFANKRSISIDDSARAAGARQNVQIKSVPVNRRPNIQTPDVKPMSAVQESPIDSPSVPIRYSVISKTSDEYYSRSSSALGECIRDSQTLPSGKPAWSSKQAETPPLAAPNALGLSMPISRLAERPPARQGPHQTKPSLTIQIKPDKPPPPPPKSPRHTRTPSIQSGVSSMHGESPSDDILATPGSIMRAAQVDLQGSPVQMPPPILRAKQGSFSSSSSDLRIREIVVTKDQTAQAKAASVPAASQPTAAASAPSADAVYTRIATSDDGKKKFEGPTRSTALDSSDDRELDGKQFPTVPVHREQAGAARLTAPGFAPRPDATTTPKHAATSSPTNLELKTGDSETNAGIAAKSTAEKAVQHQPSGSRADIIEQAGESKIEIRAAAKNMLERARELATEIRPSSKSSKPNLDKPMPSLPPNTGTLQDHLREVRQAEEAEKKERPALKTFPPSYQSSKSNDTAIPARDSAPNNNVSATDTSSPAKVPKYGPRTASAGYRTKPHTSSPSASQISLASTIRPRPTRGQSESTASTTMTSTTPAKSAQTSVVQEPVKTTSWLSSIKNTAVRESRSPTPDLAGRQHANNAAVRDTRSPAPDPASQSQTKSAAFHDSRPPTPDLASRPQSPPVTEQPDILRSKASSISQIRESFLKHSSTPEGGIGPAIASETTGADVDPIHALQEINKQVDALQVRYTQLRTDRLKLSTAISASLKDQKPGPEYANGLLDQHLSLNALSLSMDICFAKLKALDCRKEDVIATLIARTKPPSISEEPVEEEIKSSTAIKPSTVAALAVESGRSTPEIEPKTLNSTAYQPWRHSPASSAKPTPDLRKELAAFPSPGKVNTPHTTDAEKRVTVIRDQPDPAPGSNPIPPVSPFSAISSIEDEDKTKRIRIRGAKAAKLLGLVAASGTGRADSPDITLPDHSSLEEAGSKKQLAIDVEIQSKFSDVPLRPRPPPKDKAPVPKRKPVTSSRQGTNDSVGSITTSSMSESAPDEPEVKTPRNSQDAPFGLKSTKRGMLQTIQVFVDEDILDYYRTGAEK